MADTLIYPWDANRILVEASSGAADEDTVLRYNSVLKVFADTFEISPDSLLPLENTPSHTLAEMLLTYVFRPAQFKPRWVTSCFVSHKYSHHILPVMQLACLAYSLTSGTASGCYSCRDIIKGHTEDYTSGGSVTFENACTAGLLVITDLDKTFMEQGKAAMAVNEVLRHRTASRTKRTVLLLEMFDMETIKALSGNSGMQALSLFNNAGGICIPEGDDDVSLEDSVIPLPSSFNVFPDKLSPDKRKKLTEEQTAYFMEAHTQTLQSVLQLLGPTLTTKINSLADKFFVY